MHRLIPGFLATVIAFPFSSLAQSYQAPAGREFAKVAPRQAKVIELRYFGGLEEKEIAEVLRVSTRTVERDWNFARSWLMHELRS